MREKIENIISQFQLNGELVKAKNYGFGHINQTTQFTLKQNGKTKKYILQKINSNLFQNVEYLMENIENITEHLKRKCILRNEDVEQNVLNIIKTKDNKSFTIVNNEYYRIYDFIDNSICLQRTNSKKMFAEAGKAFGKFQNDLSDFDARKLHTILPNFHNTAMRYNEFIQLVETKYNCMSEDVYEVVKSLIRRKDYKDILVSKEIDHTLPLRVTHNDTKLNNIVLDKNTKKALAVLDLDTVMPSTICYDFGDAIRYGCNTSTESEKDLTKVNFNKKLFIGYTEAYLKEVKNSITPDELKMLAISPIVICYELCIRFLSDYLNGNTYFKVNYETENLQRALVQLKLLNEMENNYEFMQNSIENIFNNLVKKTPNNSVNQCINL